MMVTHKCNLKKMLHRCQMEQVLKFLLSEVKCIKNREYNRFVLLDLTGIYMQTTATEGVLVRKITVFTNSDVIK